MHSINLDVIRAVNTWLGQGEQVWYATIVQTWGASPRPVGSIFAYSPKHDELAGSLSGGCIEQDLIDELKIMPVTSTPAIKLYGVNEDEVLRLQLPCGGQIKLVLECLKPNLDCTEHFKAIENRLSRRQRVHRRLSLPSGQMSISPDTDRLSVDSLQYDHECMAHILGPEYRLLIVGAGEVARFLAPLALALEFSVVICDSRPEFIQRSQLSDLNVDVIQCLPDDLVREQFNDTFCAVVAVAHDPRVDDLALMEALETKAFFVGAMGSLKTTENRIKRLQKLGLSDEKIAKLHAPVGMAINSKTPPEIAVSIIGQLIAHRHEHNSNG